MYFPTWVDLKGEDAVPETVHHVVCMVDPQKDRSWANLRKQINTDGVCIKRNHFIYNYNIYILFLCRYMLEITSAQVITVQKL